MPEFGYKICKSRAKYCFLKVQSSGITSQVSDGVTARRSLYLHAVEDVLKTPGSWLLTVLRRCFWCNSYLMFFGVLGHSKFFSMFSVHPGKQKLPIYPEKTNELKGKKRNLSTQLMHE